MTDIDQKTTELERTVFDTLISFGAEPEDVHREATLKGLDVDSLDLVELTQVIDEEYGVKIPREEFREVVTVGDALNVIAARLP